MRIAGHNVIAVVLAGVAFWLVGAVWFGLLFSAQFQAGVGATGADAASPAWMALGALASLLTAVGLSVALRWGGLPSLPDALRRTFLLWLGFGLTCALYPLAYWPEHSVMVTMILSSYLLIGWLVAAAILATMK